jgi:hypothetical protein
MTLGPAWLALPLAVVSLATPAVAGDAVSISASGAGVTATLTTTPDPDGYASGSTITIRATTTFTESMPSVDGALVAANGRNLINVGVRDLSGDGTPEVIVSSYSGGAHCCYSATVLTARLGGGYGARVRNFGSEGYTLQTIRGHVVFASADPRFEYAFTSFAASVEPVQIWEVDATGRFRDRTRAFRSRILADLSRNGRLYRRAARQSTFSARGALAAYLADLLLARRAAKARTVLAGATASGVLAGRGDLPARVAPFVRALRRSLGRWGYGRL